MSNQLDEIPCYYVGRRLRWAGIVVSQDEGGTSVFWKKDGAE